jgi:6-phosphofructokinase 1
LTISRLDACRCYSPLHRRAEPFVDDRRRVLVCSDTEELQPYVAAGQMPPAFEMAGPRPQILFEPATLTCGIVTCGGLCPGLNNVIRSIVLTLTYAYGVPHVLGFRYGYAGLSGTSAYEPCC